jgi:hypothetical protein
MPVWAATLRTLHWVALAGGCAPLPRLLTSNIRNRHTRAAYRRAVTDFLGWCEEHGVRSLAAIAPLHVATWIEAQTLTAAAPTVQTAPRRHPAFVRDRGPKHIVRKGKTPVLEPAEARALLDRIDVTTPGGPA